MMVRDRWLPHAHPRHLSFPSGVGQLLKRDPGPRWPLRGVLRSGPARTGVVPPAIPVRMAGLRQEVPCAGRAWLPRVRRRRISIRILVPAACRPGDVALWKPGYPRRTLDLLPILPAGRIQLRVRNPWRSLLARTGHHVRCCPVKNSSRSRPSFPSPWSLVKEKPPPRRTLHEPLRHPRPRFRKSQSRHPRRRPRFLPGRIPPKLLVRPPDFHVQRSTG